MVNISSMSKHCLITVSHDLAYRIVECLLGNEPGYLLHAHTFQPLEMAILRQFIHAILPPLKDVWKPYLEITTHIHEMGTNLVALQKMPQAPTYAIVTFKIIFSASTGYLNLIYPCESIFPIRQRLDNLSTQEQALNPQNIELTLKAILGSLHLTPEELFHLKIGDVLKSEHRLGQPIDLQAENAPMMLCYPGLIYKHKGVILA
jgi:flagellar motor switch protein FliM